MRSRAFRDPGGNSSGVLERDYNSAIRSVTSECLIAYHSVPDATNNTRDDELAETPVRTKGSDTDDGSHNHDEATEQHHVSSTQSFTNEEGDQSSKERTAEQESEHRILRRRIAATHTSYTAVTVP